MKRVPLAWIAPAALVALAGCGSRGGPSAQQVLEKRFQESLSGATLVGHFTVGERTGQSEERYTLTKVSKLAGETWLFQARLQYGGRDLTVPIPLTVKWAGDTPMITLTDLTIPGVGTYTARVLFYRGQYAGTWSGRKFGGQMFGKIVKQ